MSAPTPTTRRRQVALEALDLRGVPLGKRLEAAELLLDERLKQDYWADSDGSSHQSDARILRRLLKAALR